MKLKSRDIVPGNDLWKKIIELYRAGLYCDEIAVLVNKDRTTILYHIRRSGIKIHPRQGSILGRDIQRPFSDVEFTTLAHRLRTDETILNNQKHCEECGVILRRVPNHNCKPGNYLLWD